MNNAGGRVPKEVWVGGDRVETIGDLRLWLQQIEEKYGSDKPVRFSLGWGRKDRTITQGELSAQGSGHGRDCDAVWFMMSAHLPKEG